MQNSKHNVVKILCNALYALFNTEQPVHIPLNEVVGLSIIVVKSTSEIRPQMANYDP